MKKEVQINNKYYRELDPKEKVTIPAEGYAWSEASEAAFRITLRGVRFGARYPFLSDENIYKHVALLSSEHKHQSRRVTAQEAQEWLAKGNGYLVEGCLHVMSFNTFSSASTLSTAYEHAVLWNGDTVELTAEAMGFAE